METTTTAATAAPSHRTEQRGTRVQTTRKRTSRIAVLAAAITVGLMATAVPAAANDPLPPERDIRASACPQGQVPASNFSDVGPGDPGRTAIDCLLWYEITQGRTPTTYEPNANVRRDQMASFLVRFVDHVDPTILPAAGPMPFGDVSANNVHRNAISRLTQSGIAQGTTATTYNPAGNVTREQMALFIGRTMNIIFAQDPNEGAFCSNVADYFADDDGRMSEPCINGLADVQIIRGTGPATYSPIAPVTRRQMASFLMRAMDLLVEEDLAQTP